MAASESPHDDHLPPGARQTQFLNVISRDEAEQRFQEHLTVTPPGCESIPLSTAAGRILSGEVVSDVDVPSFDRSNVDGFAIRAVDTISASEEAPRNVTLNQQILAPGVRPDTPLAGGFATIISTGGMVPRGADAVVMVEHTEVREDGLLEIHRPVASGDNIAFAGTDISCGETVLRGGQRLTSRELGVLAAIGRADVEVHEQPRVAILSTGDEIVSPGRPLPVGCVYDSNAVILSAAIAECGGLPIPMGVIPDDEHLLRTALTGALQYDVVLLSGGTSKGAGDLSYRIVDQLGPPGIVVHGVALKPGKPICLAVCNGTPVVVLPGFPTSAIFTFHEFVAPLIRRMSGRPARQRHTLPASLPMRINSQRGRTEYLLVSLFERNDEQLTAYPIGRGSGSVTTFSRADGFVTIDQQTEILEEGTDIEVSLLDESLRPADLTVISSHCLGLDRLLSHLQRRGFAVKIMTVGSTGALSAARRGECDVAGIHLLDPQTGTYNRPFLSADLELLEGYQRLQCLVFRPGDYRFEGKTIADAVRSATEDTECHMVNRNPGSGTRILLDRLLEGFRVESTALSGYGIQMSSHNAICAAVHQGRADWGVAIENVATMYGLKTTPIADESFDFVVPRSRQNRPAVKAFVSLLGEDAIRQELRELGFRFSPQG